MLSEEALIVLAGFGACGLLVLGVLELLWPTRPRHPVRARRRPLPARTAHVHRTSSLQRHPLEGRRNPYIRRAPIALTPDALPAEVAVPVAVPAVPVLLPEPAATSEVPRVGAIVDECFALQQAGRHEDVVELAMAALHGPDEARRPADAHTTAALWSVVALSRQGLGEDVEARDALQAAIEAAPAADRPTYQRQLAALADGVARRLLAEAEQQPHAESEACLEAIRGATAWLAHGMTAMPGDTALAELRAFAQATLWRAYERTVMVLLQRQEFRAARRLLREALDDPRVPADRVEAFRGMLTGSFSGEIGQLTAQAIRSVQDDREADALHALRRAETLLGTLSDEALSAARREEVDRRLWWVYSKLGERRLEAGEHEAALEPLVHALGYDVGAEPHEATRTLLERALDGAPDREAAIVRCDRLWARLHGAKATLAGDELASAPETAPGLFETLGR